MLGIRYYLTRHAYFCLDGRYCLFLDLRRNKYVCTERTLVEALSPWLFGWPQQLTFSDDPIPDEPATLACELVKVDLLTTRASQGREVKPPDIAEAQRSLIEVQAVQSWRDTSRSFPSFLVACWHAHTALRHQPLERIIRNVERTRLHSRHPTQPLALDRAIRLVLAFRALRGFFPRNYLCLFDSLALLHFLAAHDIYASWVFGVQSDPFKAHCWLQNNNTVLNDTVERALSFRPIMVV